MADPVTIPLASEALVDGDRKPAASWYRVLQRVARTVNTPPVAVAAAAVSYDNTTSGLAATDVQAAVDELGGGPVLIASGTLSGSQVDITGIPQNFSKLLLRITGLSFDTAARNPVLQVSADNGSSFDTTAGNYSFFASTSGALVVASLLTPLTHTLAAGTSNHALEIGSYQAGSYPLAYGFARDAGGFVVGWASYFGSTAAINALRIAVAGGAGSFDGGAWALYGAR